MVLGRSRARWQGDCIAALRRAEQQDYVMLPLTQGYETKIDKDDYEFVVSTGPWSAYPRLRCVYAAKNAEREGNYVKTYLHGALINTPDGMEIDHINGDGLDNRRANPRAATHSQNVCNRKKATGSTSQYLGVWRDKARKCWATQLQWDGKRVCLGRFASEVDAAHAYDKAAREYHGKFANLNFPEEL